MVQSEGNGVSWALRERTPNAVICILLPSICRTLKMHSILYFSYAEHTFLGVSRLAFWAKMKGVARLELERGTDGRAPVDTPMVPKERDGASRSRRELEPRV